jgi:hypothetical protein
MYKYFPLKEQLKRRSFGRTKVDGGAWLLDGPHNVKCLRRKLVKRIKQYKYSQKGYKTLFFNSLL